MKTKKYTLTEKDVKKAIGSVLKEFLDRGTVDAMSNLGINDPTEQDVVDKNELKQKCQEFIQKTNEYFQYFKQFYGYIDGVEEDEEKGIKGVRGVRDVIRSRNLFGARDVSDEILQENLEYFCKTLFNLESALQDTVETAENLL